MTLELSIECWPLLYTLPHYLRPPTLLTQFSYFSTNNRLSPQLKTHRSSVLLYHFNPPTFPTFLSSSIIISYSSSPHCSLTWLNTSSHIIMCQCLRDSHLFCSPLHNKGITLPSPFSLDCPSLSNVSQNQTCLPCMLRLIPTPQTPDFLHSFFHICLVCKTPPAPKQGLPKLPVGGRYR